VVFAAYWPVSDISAFLSIQLAMLAGIPERADPEAIKSIRLRITICDGQVVFGG
jgi:hypothetical protein